MEHTEQNPEQETNLQEEVSTQNQEVNPLEAQLAEAQDKFVRLYAEFDNYKRRTLKERAELLNTVGKDIVVALLPIIDDFERAIKAGENTQDVDAIKEGIALIYNKFNQILSGKGLKPLSSTGEEFNVDTQEAIANVPAPTEDMKGKVIEEIEKGYTLNGQVIRFAKVIVGE